MSREIKRLYQFSFKDNAGRTTGHIFIVERSVKKAIIEANRKIGEECYNEIIGERNLEREDSLRVHDDETVGVYEVIYPYG